MNPSQHLARNLGFIYKAPGLYLRTDVDKNMMIINEKLDQIVRWVLYEQNYKNGKSLEWRVIQSEHKLHKLLNSLGGV